MLIDLIRHQRPLMSANPRHSTTFTPSRYLNRRVLITIAAGLGVALLSYEYMHSSRKHDEASYLTWHSPARPESVGVFSSWRHEGFSTVDTNGRKRPMWHPLMTIIPALHDGQSWNKAKYPDLDHMTKQERSFIRDITSSFLQKRPTLLLVDIDPPTPSMQGFEYLEYFSADPRFAREMSEYEFETRTPKFRVYRRRNSPTQTQARFDRTATIATHMHPSTLLP